MNKAAALANKARYIKGIGLKQRSGTLDACTLALCLGSRWSLDFNGKALKVPGTDIPVQVPSLLVGQLLIAEWEGSFAPLPDRPALIVPAAPFEILHSYSNQWSTVPWS